MKDEWYFEIGDGQTYGPFPLEKLRKWAEAGDLMPTHRVRHSESTEWLIAAHIPELKETLQSTKLDATMEFSAAPTATVAPLRATIGSVFSRRGGRTPTAATQEAPSQSGPSQPTSAEPKRAEPTSAAAWCNEILHLAITRSASDVHIEPEEDVTLIQLRIDGELETTHKLPHRMHSAIVGRIKVMANMDIAEHRAAQDGSFRFEYGPDKRRIDIRVACLPTTHGERLTLRLLAVQMEQLTIQHLGLSRSDLQHLTNAISARQGLVLVTGPTGSGKSTTLYAALRYIQANQPGKKIITIEDPVEFDIVGVAQVDVEKSDKLRFHDALRNVLRSDPDVIMIGEMRDQESADIALKAALTGHLVLSSLHTNSAAGAITRLVDLGIPPYLIVATVRLGIAQRLLRHLCPNCRRGRRLTDAEARSIGRPPAAGSMIYERGSCEQCYGRGYRGRIGVFEALPMDPELGRRLVSGGTEVEIRQYQLQQRYPLLIDDGVDKLLHGWIQIEDLLSLSI